MMAIKNTTTDSQAPDHTVERLRFIELCNQTLSTEQSFSNLAYECIFNKLREESGLTLEGMIGMIKDIPAIWHEVTLDDAILGSFHNCYNESLSSKLKLAREIMDKSADRYYDTDYITKDGAVILYRTTQIPCYEVA